MSLLIFSLLFIFVSVEPLILTKETFDTTLATGKPCFVKFFAPWCGHCKRLAPTWDQLADEYMNTTVVIAKVDCTTDTSVCSEHGVSGYPTLKLFVGSHQISYTGQRDLKSLKEFVEQQVKSDEGDEVGLVHLDDKSFPSFIEKNGVHFVKFFAPWCGHCQKLAPTWEELATYYKSNSLVHISKIDCTQNTVTCGKYGVKGYPTLLLFEGGEPIDKYKGGRGLDALIQYVKDNFPVGTSDEKSREERSITPVDLTADTFHNTISEGVTFVMFYAPWCGHCKRLAPVWERLAEVTHSSSHATIAKVDCTVEKELCEKFEVRGFPTLILFSEGEKKAEYTKARDLDSLLEFLKEHS